MKTRNLVLALLTLLGIVPLSMLLADDVPAPYTFARYQPMMDRSPFAVATAVAAPVATPNFAKDLYVANAAHDKEGDFITIASSADKNFKKYPSSTKADDGYSIVSIEWSDKVGQTKVTIAKDGQTATIGFNEALIKQPTAAGQPPQMPEQRNPQAQPIVPPAITAQQLPQPNYQQQRPAPVPQLPTPPPRVRGVIPKNPNAALTPVPAATVVPTPEVEL